MKKCSLFFAFICFFSVPVFAVVLTFDEPTNGQCFCQKTCDFDAQNCVFHGDCDGTQNCPTQFLCQGNGVCFRTTYIMLQSLQLVYNDIKRKEFDIARTGMMGTTEGTYPDYEEIYIFNGTTALTNEINIISHWCK
jgi:hypothetical protein